ncbi:MAG TPA: glycosyltransferase family 4 protein, partial [Thermoanaerobaculia bacterium]|nr:glycosyltransferase family 4 protein [Thermoanaerobaculia bacterium]
MPRLFIATPTHSLQGGVERILEALARLLPARGFEVVFGLVRGSRFNDPTKFRAAFPGITGVEVDGRSGTSYGRRRALRRAIVEVDPDVVLIARLFDAYPAACELKHAGHRLRLALTIQAYEPEYFIDLGRYAGSVDVVITSGELIRSEAVRSLPEDRVVDIPGGIAIPHRFVTRSAGPLRIGYVGRLAQTQKRALDLIALDAELRRRGIAFTLDVAGDGEVAGELRERLPDARFHGWTSTDELYERVYPELDVLVHFAEWEGITIAPREAMAHGVVPVISSFPGHAQQFLHDGNALVFPVGDVRAAADAIARLSPETL